MAKAKATAGAAPAGAEATAPAAMTYKVGDVVAFKGYAEAPPAGEEIFKPGDKVKIMTLGKDENGNDTFSVTAADGKSDTGETLYADEIEAVKGRVRGGAKAGALTSEQKAEAKAKAKAEKAAAKALAQANKPKVLSKEEKEAEALKNMTVSNSVKSALKGRSALEAAKMLATRAEETDYALGGVLATIKRDGLWKEAGFPDSPGIDGFGQYTKAVLGIEYRVAQALVRNYLTFSALKVDEKSLQELGWSKAKVIAGVATAENYPTLAEFAKTHNRDELVAHVQATYQSSRSGGSGPRAAVTRYKFALAEGDAKVANKVFATAKKAIGTVNGKPATDNDAIRHVIMEYAQMTEGVEVTLAQAVSTLEARFGVTVKTEKATPPGRSGGRAKVEAPAAQVTA